MKDWLDLFRQLGAALFALGRAEVAALQADLARSGRTLGVALALFAAAAMAGFWLIALVLYTLIQVIEIWLPPWGAALCVCGAFLLLIVVLAWVGLSRFKRIKSPAKSFEQRWKDHSDWWNGQLLAATAEPVPPSASAPGAEAESGASEGEKDAR